MFENGRLPLRADDGRVAAAQPLTANSTRDAQFSAGLFGMGLPGLASTNQAAQRHGFDPQAAYRDYQRQRPMTLADLLLENRVIFLQGEIWDGIANELVMKLLYLQSENRRKEIHFYINSPGGSITATMAIYDTMQILSCQVATYCVGLAASGGAVLLAGGAAGKRFALPHSKVMIHQPHGAVGGQVSDIEIQAKEILKSREEMNKILARHTGQPIERIARDTDRDFYMSAQESKDYKIVDDILTKQIMAAEEEA